MRSLLRTRSEPSRRVATTFHLAPLRTQSRPDRSRRSFFRVMTMSPTDAAASSRKRHFGTRIHDTREDQLGARSSVEGTDGLPRLGDEHRRRARDDVA